MSRWQWYGLGLPVISGHNFGGFSRPDRHRAHVGRDSECHKTNAAQLQPGERTVSWAQGPDRLPSSFSSGQVPGPFWASSPGWLTAQQRSNCENPDLASSRCTATPRAASKHSASLSDETQVTCLPRSRQLCPLPTPVGEAAWPLLQPSWSEPPCTGRSGDPAGNEAFWEEAGGRGPWRESASTP